MKRTILLIFTFGLFSVCSFGQQLDQSNSGMITSQSWVSNNNANTSVAQSFTAGKNGVLESLTISLDNNPPISLLAGDFLITFRDGDGYSGSTIGVQNFSITGSESTGDFNIPISSTISLASGNVYTFIITETTSTGLLKINRGNDSYASGSLYEQLGAGIPINDVSKDLLFETYMVTCMPNYTVSNLQNTICNGDSTLISTSGSVNGVHYFLRDTSTNMNVGDTLIGTGSALDFNTSALTDTTGFVIFAVDSNTTINNAINFTGNSNLDKVNIGSGITSSLETTNSITVEAWVNAASGTGLHNIVGNYDNGEMQFLLRIANGVPDFFIHDGLSLTNCPASTTVTGGWTHLAGVWDGTTMKIYVNGVEENSTAKSGSFPACPNDATIAGGLSNNTEYFEGDIAQVKIWNTTRTAQEIADNMSNCVTSMHPNLLAAYNMIDGLGTTLTDDSGNGNDGTLQGNSSWVSPALPYSCYCELTLGQSVVVNVYESSIGVDIQTACGSFTWIDGVTYTASNNTAKDTLTNMVGCDSIVTLNLTIDNVDNGITNNGITLTADATGATYQWIDCDNNNIAIMGETGQSFTPTSDGNYAVVVTENNCTDTSDCEAISGVGIENTILNQIKVYPNPTEGQVQINMGSNIGNYAYTLTSVDGKMIISEKDITENILRLNLEDKAVGVYLFIIQTKQGNQTMRIVKN